MSADFTLNRRMLLASLAAALAPMPAFAQSAERIAVIDWAMLETLLMLGVQPVAATELIQYRKIVLTPPVSESTADIGLRGTPNLELLRTVAPDLILSSNFYEYARPTFERIAPVFTATVYDPGHSPFDLATAATSALGERLGLAERASAAIADASKQIGQTRAALSRHAGRPAFIVSIGDSRHFRAFGKDSMFGDVLARLGFANAWTADTSYAAAAPVGIEALAGVPDAMVVIIAPIPPEARWTLRESGLWKALPMVAAGRVMVLDPVNHFGGLPAALRFASLLREGVEQMPHG
jgi:iron complex transport system substrate-binding protein